MLEWYLKKIPLKYLKSHEKNPRQISKDNAKKLEGLIKKFGLIDKPIVNPTENGYTIIGGHQRLQILKKMKVKEVECWIPDRELQQEDLDHLCIGLNLNQGTWDWDILANEWEPIDLLEYGFTEDQLLGHSDEIEHIESETQKEKSKKTTSCPNCGHEF